MTHDPSTESLRLLTLSLIQRFALSNDEVNALTRQGFVSREKGARRPYVCLRYRVQGRQRALYVRPADAELLGAELELLQKRVGLVDTWIFELATRSSITSSTEGYACSIA